MTINIQLRSIGNVQRQIEHTSLGLCRVVIVFATIPHLIIFIDQDEIMYSIWLIYWSCIKALLTRIYQHHILLHVFVIIISANEIHAHTFLKVFSFMSKPEDLEMSFKQNVELSIVRTLLAKWGNSIGIIIRFKCTIDI